MKRSKVALILAALLFILTLQAAADPVLSLGTVTTGQGNTVNLGLNLSSNAQPIGGLNAKILLPDGVTCVGINPGAIAPPGFVLDYQQGPSGQDGVVTVFGYSSGAPVSASAGQLLSVALSVSPTTPPGTYPVVFAMSDWDETINTRHALSDADGSSSLFHTVADGTLTVDAGTWPEAAFHADKTQGVPPLTVQFTDTSLAGSDVIVAWSWDFGDGSAIDTTQNPVHVYDEDGAYSVSLTVTTSVGSDTETKSNYISVTPSLPLDGSGALLLLVSALSMGGTSAIRRRWMRRRNCEDYSQNRR